ncbi:DUF4142 domain-containing protein [Hymenobacter aerilatus]|uniref:DUF4142 domain-containing protein n=1 Tax=Hymenobacter aerilatus TaxID=2932251 RepID=A0A8T9SSB3_9BACT|nr:DUF4142 domain-containing protein [Hymenobacter aerilatus]UOR04637.1 DUF4142 domain-containing protein [Hymenobacter aerilatus]
MKSTTTYLLGALLVGSFSLATAPPAQAQKKPVKEAEKINKKRNKLQADSSPYSKDQLQYDAEFAVAASSSNMLEIALGKLAQQKAIAMEVKEWGKRMEQEHGQAEQQLQAIAERAHIALPQMMGKEDRDIYDDIDDRKYFGFDKKYMRDLQELHKRTIARFADAAAKASNPELRTYATEMLPKLREHEEITAQLFERASDRK